MPHTRPLVSVIVPACNAAAHLQETIDCVLRQTLPSFELIIVDDGSTDDTPDIASAAEIRDRRVRLVRRANAGVGAARNAGLHLARGEYIAPLDADDLWSPRKLEKQVARLEHAGPKAGLAYCWSRNIDRAGRVISWAHPCRIEGRVLAALLLGNLAGNASVPLFRASALAAVGGYMRRDEQDGAQGCEDWDLNIRVAENFELRCVPEYLVSYRQSSSGMSLNARAMLRSYEATIRRTVQRNPRLSPRLLTWSRSRFYTYLASKCYTWSDYAGALSFTTRTLRLDPLAWLNSRHYRVGLLSIAHLLSRGALRRHRSPPAVTAESDPYFRIAPTPFPSPNSLFALLERRRLALALGVRPHGRSASGTARPVFG
jgi:Glycosyltransferases involved in cell wall biogenesis